MRNRPTIHLLGDSLIDYGDWPRLLPDYRTVSAGVPGERAEELLARLPALAEPECPAAFVIMTGTNNLLLSGSGSLVPTIAAMVRSLGRHCPRSPVVVTGLPPFRVPGTTEVIQTFNRHLAELDDGTAVHFLSLYEPFARSEMEPFDFDGVHLSRDGYRLWGRLLQERLTGLLAKWAD